MAGASQAATGTPPSASLREKGVTLHDRLRASNWTARGLTKVVGAVDVGEAELDGVVVVGEGFTAERLAVHGTLDVRGPLVVRGELTLHGTIRAGQAVRAGEATLGGSVRADGPIVVDRRLVARASLTAPSVTALDAHLAGVVRVPGELRATTVDVELAEGSSLGSVVGRSVRLTGPEGGVLDRLLGRYRHAEVERIEGETVEVERVDVGTVAAKQAVLGRDAHVVRLDAVTVRAHPSSRVGPESRTPPPPGLRR